MSPAEAVWAATAGGAAALQRTDIGRIRVGARADLRARRTVPPAPGLPARGGAGARGLEGRAPTRAARTSPRTGLVRARRRPRRRTPALAPAPSHRYTPEPARRRRSHRFPQRRGRAPQQGPPRRRRRPGRAAYCAGLHVARRPVRAFDAGDVEVAGEDLEDGQRPRLRRQRGPRRREPPRRPRRRPRGGIRHLSRDRELGSRRTGCATRGAEPRRPLRPAQRPAGRVPAPRSGRSPTRTGAGTGPRLCGHRDQPAQQHRGAVRHRAPARRALPARRRLLGRATASVDVRGGGSSTTSTSST